MALGSGRILLDFVVVASAMSLMVRTGLHYKLLARRPLRRCAACRLRPPDCRCRDSH